MTSPDERETLDREIRHRTDHLGSLLVGHHRQQALDSAALQAAQEQLVRQWSKPLKNDGRVKMGIRTAHGTAVSVWVTDYRRKGQRGVGKRNASVYAGLVLLGMYDRCTPALAAEVSLLAAMLCSLDEAQAVLADRGMALETKTVRLIAYRYAARARLKPQIEKAVFEDTVAGRRVVISSDGGRLRRRETKRGPRPKRGATAIRVVCTMHGWEGASLDGEEGRGHSAIPRGAVSLSQALPTIVADSPQSTAPRVLGMQGIVQALITRPQLDPFPFRQRHIQTVIRPLLVLVGYGESAVGKGGHIAEHKG